MKKPTIITLGKKTYQSRYATVAVDKPVVRPFEKITIKGKKFTSFKQRGNPGIAVLIDGRPLTGASVNDKGSFKVSLKMPPFAPGKHTISVFGVETTITVKDDSETITAEQLREILKRDFIITDDCHLLLSDEKYRVCPLDVLECFLNKNDVNKKRYVAEWFDCDDFSDALHGQFTFDTYPKGYAHGELWVNTKTGGHAVNCFLVKDGNNVKMVVVEPQSDSIFAFPKDWSAFVIKI